MIPLLIALVLGSDPAPEIDERPLEHVIGRVLARYTLSSHESDDERDERAESEICDSPCRLQRATERAEGEP